MGRLWTAGAESGSALSENVILSTNATISTTKARSGSRSFKCDSTAGNTVATVEHATTLAAYVRGYFLFDNLPGATVRIIRIIGETGASATVSARLTAAGKLQLWNDTGTPAQIGSDSAATISADGTTWYRIELYFKEGGASLDEAELRLDGVTVSSTSAVEISGDTGFYAMLGWIDVPGASKICYVDDVALNGTAGADQNSWPGSGKIVNLIPISDNARAAKWTGGALGTTNLFDAVNNTPPIGTATETDLTQIEHSGGAAGTTDAYDANMTTYTTAGLVTGDTVKVIQLVAAHGEDIVTGAKLLAFSVVSNPAIASSGNVTAGDATPDALGTYPTEWGIHRGTTTYNSTPTFGTSPVMRSLRPETATRVASVCYMAMVVEYQPAVAPSANLPNPIMMVTVPFPFRAVG